MSELLRPPIATRTRLDSPSSSPDTFPYLLSISRSAPEAPLYSPVVKIGIGKSAFQLLPRRRNPHRAIPNAKKGTASRTRHALHE